MSFLIYSASLKKITAKQLILFFVAIFFCLYGFGGLGNIRHGYVWDNTSMIEDTAKVNNKYPEWLPKQFLWSYIYIICGLGNLNHNIIIDSAEPNIYTFSTSPWAITFLMSLFVFKFLNIFHMNLLELH